MPRCAFPTQSVPARQDVIIHLANWNEEALNVLDRYAAGSPCPCQKVASTTMSGTRVATQARGRPRKPASTSTTRMSAHARMHETMRGARPNGCPRRHRLPLRRTYVMSMFAKCRTPPPTGAFTLHSGSWGQCSRCRRSALVHRMTQPGPVLSTVAHGVGGQAHHRRRPRSQLFHHPGNSGATPATARIGVRRNHRQTQQGPQCNTAAPVACRVRLRVLAYAVFSISIG